MAGKYFEDCVPGMVMTHEVTRTVTETDNLLITTLTHNTQPLHLDAEIAKQSEFGRPLVNSVFTFGLMIGVSVSDTTLGTLVANLGYDQVRFPKPVFVGDTLTTTSEVTEVRASQSRPTAGIVTFKHRCYNQRGELVAECLRSALLRKRAV